VDRAEARLVPTSELRAFAERNGLAALVREIDGVVARALAQERDARR